MPRIRHGDTVGYFPNLELARIRMVSRWRFMYFIMFQDCRITLAWVLWPHSVGMFQRSRRMTPAMDKHM